MRYRFNIERQASSLYNESNMQNQFTSKCLCCHAFQVFTTFMFCKLFFVNFADEVVRLVFILQYFSWSHSPISFLLRFHFTWNILKHLRCFVL